MAAISGARQVPLPGPSPDGDGMSEEAIAAMLGWVPAGGKDKLSRGQKKRSKQKQRRQTGSDAAHAHDTADEDGAHAREDGAPAAVELEYVTPDLVAEIDTSNPELAQFVDVFQRFGHVRGAAASASASTHTHAAEASAKAAPPPAAAEPDAPTADIEPSTPAEPKLSRRARKEAVSASLSSLKLSAARPEVVEAHDASSSDPVLLVHLKAYRNTVPIPRHWCHKRKYLSAKKGFDKPAFELPAFIEATGIAKLRGADLEAAEAKSLKTRQRDRFIPKMGRIEIDYEVLHDAFFKHQTKPRMTRFGDLYYEGRETENNFAETKKPGMVSEKLRAALGMQEGAPPPWLVNMQRYGPPPSYPNLRIPGVNAPLPQGASYGTAPGQWGRPPVDEFGRPLYGDVFGVLQDANADTTGLGTGAVKHLWGEIREDEPPLPSMSATGLEDEDAMLTGGGDGDAEEEAVPPPPPPAGTETPFDGSMSVQRSIMSGMDTPDVLNLRKGARESGLETPDTTTGPAPELYRVLEEKKSGLQGTLLGTTHTYIMLTGPAVSGKSAASSKDGGVAVALAPEEVEGLSEASLLDKYEAQVRQDAAATAKEDMSDLLEEQERKRRRKDAAASGQGKKKARTEFKF